MKNLIKLSAAVALPALLIGGCSPMGHLATRTGKPEVTIYAANWKTASIAIAEYNFSKGRKLDQVLPRKIVTYEAVPVNNGTEEVTFRNEYDLSAVEDSLVISSHRYVSDDLDDSDVAEADDQATYEIEQQELNAIAASINTRNTIDMAEPIETR